jgi:nitronate monooxygenase
MLAGMGGVARHELAAAVANAGGFAVLGMVREPVERIRHEITQLRSRTRADFAVNLIPAATDKALLRAQVAECLAQQVPSMVLFWRVDTALVQHLKQEGVQVIHQVGSLRDAEAALAAGADVLMAQGLEAGGHVRGLTSTLSLVPPMVALSKTPVVAAGGIACGRSLAAALALGAQGVSIGSAFLATTEANAHPHHKQRLVDAGSDDTLHTQLFTGNWHEPAPVRVLHNDITQGQYRGDANTVIGRQDDSDVYAYSTDSPLADATGQVDLMALYCGQGVGQIHNIVSARERIEQIVEGASELF